MLDHDTLMIVKPRARTGVIARPVGNEVVIYDSETHRAHCLNRTAAIVLHASNGENSVAAIAQTLALETGTAPDEDVVWVTLERLAETKLIESMPSSRVSVSRRCALRQVTISAAALAPLVASLLVPTPAQAAATCIQEAACDATTIGNQCFVLAQAECATKVCTGVSVCQ
jgi:Coenzyme PQQ synthesis protein D (PqqD)